MSYKSKQNRIAGGGKLLARNLLCGVSAVATLVALGAPSGARAEERYWDANGTAVNSGGTGTWNLNDLTWSPSGDGVSGPYNLPWNNTAFDDAVFGGLAGTVSLGAPITAHNLTFNTAGYTLTGGTLTLAGAAPTITNGGSTTINSVIAGSSGLTKAGGGALTLGGANTFAGDIHLNLGRINGTSDAAFGAASNIIHTGAGASVGVTIAGANTAREIRIGNGGVLTLGGAGAGSALITGNGRVVAANGLTLSNDASTYTGSTTFNGVNGIANNYFTSIADLGVASSLGAPTTVLDGTIVFNQSSQYSDNIIYIGTGHSSNRNWRITGAAANIRNRGTGTLTITGDVAGGATFAAESADIALMGTLSGNNFGFTGSAGRTVTLGGLNTFTGNTFISVITIGAEILADKGLASSLGAGNTISLGSNGALSYIGSGASTDRDWTVSGFGAILNNGTGALDLSGGSAFVAGNPVDTLTLGGSFAGDNTFAGVISGAGHLTADGAGAWVLSGANTFSGNVTVNSGTLRAGSSSAFGTPTGFIVNGGTLDLGGFDLTAPSLTGSGGTVALGASTLTVAGVDAQTYAGGITGSGGLTKTRAGTLTLTGASTYTGATTIAGGKLALDFSGTGGPANNLLSASSTLVLSGGVLEVLGAAGEANSQGFDGLTVSAGSNTVRAINGAGGAVNLNLGAITRNGGLVNFALPVAGAISTSNADGLLGGWATVNGTDYAKVNGGIILAFDETDYTDKDDAGAWLSGDIVSDTGNAANTPFFGAVSGDVQLGGLRYTAAADSTVTVGSGNTLGVDGTIIVAPSTLATNQTITGGFLTGGAGGGSLGVQHNGAGALTIGSVIVDNAGDTAVAKGGTGTLVLTGSNSYTGATILTGGMLRVSSINNGGVASSIGASSADASNLVLEGGTLQYTGATAGTDRGFTLVNGGTSRIIEVVGGTDLTFSGVVTSPDDAGFTKMNSGTLTLANAANTYSGITTVGGGTLAITTLTDGGLASSIGMASSDPANIVLAGGTLDYLGATTSSDRGITIGAGNGGVGVADAGAVLTLSGTITSSGSGGLRKEGDGTLVLSGANTYAGGTVVNGGTLVAGSAQAFGPGNASMTVNSGATLDLGGFNVRAAGLTGDGTINLGANTFTSANGSMTFGGVITGTGGFTRGPGSYTQVLSGCNNTYTGVTTVSGLLSIDCIANGGQASSIGASGAASANLVLNGDWLNYTGASVTTDRGFTAGGSSAYLGVTQATTTLEFTGAAVGTGGLHKGGAGTLVLSGANTYAGGTTIREGILRAGSAQAFGNASAMSLYNVAGTTLDLGGYDIAVSYLTGGGTTGGLVDLGGNTLMITTGNNTGSINYAGKITGAGNLIKNGGSTQRLSGCDSDYTGTTTINGGAIEVTCLVDGGLASSLGASAADPSNLTLNGGTLRYVGTGGSTNRQFTLGSSAGNALDASGTGAISFTSTAPLAFSSPNTAQTLTLTGTNRDNNILAAQINNNGTGLTGLSKTGTGTWILTNPVSNYTGVTTISGGVLGVDKLSNGGVASSIGASSAAAANLVIGNNSTLRYTGAGDTTDRLFTLAAGVSFIESSGTGAVVFTDTGAVTLQGNNQSRVIALGGTNTDNNTLAGSIGDAGAGVTTLAKNDSGTWVLTGNHSYSGSTNINGGLLSIGGGGTTGSVASATINNFGALAFNRSDSLTYDGAIVGTGGVRQIGTGTTILTGANTYSGGTTVNAGVLQLGNGGTTGSIIGDVVNDGVLAFNRSNGLTFAGVISGSGRVTQDGAGTTILTGFNTYAGGTAITGGTLQVSSDANLGAASGALSINNGALQTTANIASARNVTVAGNATLLTNAGTGFTLSGAISGAGGLTKSGAGELILTGANTYAGDTTISAGTLRVGAGGTTGSITGDVVNNGALIFDRANAATFDGLISGAGSVTKFGSGVLTLTGNNSYTGATTLNAGTVLINGDQSAATGLTTVNTGATLGGNGAIGGDVFIDNGGILSPGDGLGTLTIGGDLTLSGGSILNYAFGQANVAGGALNDLVEVGGDLVLDGTINVSVPASGAFGGGIYRVFNYNGALTDNGLALGAMPGGSSVTVQTSVAGQVNLVNSAGLSLSFWDGGAGPKFNDAIDGGDGVWHLDGVDNNWTNGDGSVNAAYADGTLAIFAGLGGAVTVDNTGGAVTASGLQFASDGYTITGDALTLVGPQSVIRVGDGTALGADMTATIGAELAGATQLVKTDLGTLVLTGTNSYTGGALIDAGTLSISSNANLGAAAGGITIKDGTLLATTGMVIDRAITLTGAATLSVQPGAALAVEGIIDGAGSLTTTGGLVTLTADNTYTGGTTISEGTLQIGAGGATGSIVGDVVNNAALVFNRSNDLVFEGAVSGSGQLTQAGAGTLTMNGVSTYSGATTILAGALVLETGGQINGTSSLTVSGDGKMIIDGAGSQLVAGPTASIIGADANSTGALVVRNGGSASFAQLDMANGLNAGTTLDIIGAGSQLTHSGQGNFGQFGSATVTIADGGRMVSGASAYVGGQDATALGVVTVTGPGSEWTVADAINVRHGSLTVADGGIVSAGSATMGFNDGAGPNSASADLIVSGAGSRFETTGDLAITDSNVNSDRGTLTIADGGMVRVGGSLALGAGDAVLNIGGVEGGAAAHAGLLEADAITFAATTNRVNFNHDDAAYVFAAEMSGAGAVFHNGPGTTILTGDNSYTGATTVNAGTLLVNGDQSAATGPTSVASGATLGGTGNIGGDVVLVDGATINPGDLGAAPGELTIGGNLVLANASNLDYNFGQANVVGGSLNDLITVGGDLTLDGTLNVQTSGGGSFDAGVYRVISYTGSLTDNGLTVGAIPSGTDFYVQTSVAQQVNLINTSGLALRFWDGDAGGRNDGVIAGGDGVWQNVSGSDNWTEDTGAVNAPFLDSAFAVFMGAAGTVTVDNSLGAVNVSGMQFLTDGYVIEGDALNLAGPQATIRVGDGTAAGADATATIASELTGTAQLVKSDLGTLILSGANSYTGGTAINGGVLQISADDNLGTGGLTFNGGTLRTTLDMETDRAIDLAGNGALLTDAGTTLGLTGVVSGAGGLIKNGAGVLVLSGANTYEGGAAVNAGSLFVNGDQSGVTGLTQVNLGAMLGGAGVIGGDVAIADGATLDPGDLSGLPGTLTIGGSLSLSSGSTLAMQFGEANAVGGGLNDLIEVGGDLILDGTLNVSVPLGGTFGPGIYRVINYGGTLTNNGLELGVMPNGSAANVQTSITGQINLVNTDGLSLNFWDGDAGPKFNNAVDGGDGVWQNGAGNSNWTDMGGAVNAGYTDNAFAIFAGVGGVVTIDNSLGDVSASGMQIAADGYSFVGDKLTLVGTQSTIRVGDGSTAGAEFTATIAAELAGAAQLIKTDAGTLILSGNNSYTGGTVIEGGVLQISEDANLGDVAGGLTFANGTLKTTADLESDRALSFTDKGSLLVDGGTTLTLNGALSGAGVMTKDGEGVLLLTGDSSGYNATTVVARGTFAVDGLLGGGVAVSSGGRLEGIGQVGGVTNGGIVAPGGNGIGTLTIAGDYVGNGGALEIETALGGDNSATDRLVVTGATSGNTQVTVLNRDGVGEQTVDGIKIIDVAGASNGTFTLNGDYLFQGEQAVVAGAYSYRLHQGGVTTPTDGDWYLRSSLTDPVEPETPTAPIYQPGVPVYEAYGANLLSLNGLSTLRQRVGNRTWANGTDLEGDSGVWGRVEGTRNRADYAVSTSQSDQRVDSWKVQFGVDQVIASADNGDRLVAGLTAYYGEADTRVGSVFGNGSIQTDAFGVGATLTWHGQNGVYVDGQAQLSWYNSDLDSHVLGKLKHDNGGDGQAFSLEVGKRMWIDSKLSVTPQIQTVYSNVRFDLFADPNDALVKSDKGDSLKTRWGISLDHESEWDGGRSHVYAVANLSHEWLDGTRARVSGTPLDYATERTWGEIGLGASVSWTRGVTFYGEVSTDSPVKDFGDSYMLKANAGVRITF